MYYFLSLLALFVISGSMCQGQAHNFNGDVEFLKDTADRARDHGYPGEKHQFETSDNYVITLFRIPYSPKLQNSNQRRPAILLQHGLTSCSDAWLLNGPNDALAFLMADAGYDVWMSNQRGNKYSRNNTKLSPNHPFFWRFSWHEIGYFDMAESIDYILDLTKETALHYVGHSQGTTVFFVLMSSRPEYNAKIKSAHMLAPVAFMGNMSSVLAKYTRPLLGRPNKITGVLDTMEILGSASFCNKNPLVEFLCKKINFLLIGDNNPSGNINMTIVQHINETHPAGASSNQVLHYLQEYETGRFCQFDYGVKKNLKNYGQAIPPDYDVTQITSAVHLYYSDADTLADVLDVEHLASLLPNLQGQFHVPDPTFTHVDFAASLFVKEVINDRILAACNKYEENTAGNGS